jgi:hypothetical protein
MASVQTLSLDLRPLTEQLGGRLDYDQPSEQCIGSDALSWSDECLSGSCKTFAVAMSRKARWEMLPTRSCFYRRERFTYEPCET